MENRSGVIHIRAAVKSDLARVLEIERQASTAAHWSQQAYENAIVSDCPLRLFTIAESSGRIEAFLVARRLHPLEWEIENIIVAEAARRLGVGSALLSAFLEHLRSAKQSDEEALVIRLEVRESNLAARRLYEKFGFLLDSRRAAYYANPVEDAILYRTCYQ